jgi:SP family xylose:H+ symportor-like MFS transporter
MAAAHSQTKVFAATLIAALGGLLFGYDTAVISGAVSAIDVNFIKPQNLGATEAASLLGFAVGSALLGTVLGSAVAGVFAARIGRKMTMVIAAVMFAVSAIGSAYPELIIGAVGEMGPAALWPFILYRIIGGVGIGLASVVCPMYIAEIAPRHLRGRLVSLNQFAIVTGIFGVYFVNYYIASLGDTEWVNATGWRWMLLSEVVFAIAFLLLLFVTPESPRWLVSKGRLEEARGVLGRFNPPAEVGAVLDDIRASLAKAPSAPVFSFGVLVIVVGVMLSVFQQFVGINAVLYYAPEIFKNMGASSNAAFMQTVIVGGVNFIFTLIAYVTVDRYGRKPLLLWGALIMAASMLALGTFFYNQSLGLPALAAMLIYVAGFALSWGPVVWVLLSEMFPNSIRNAALPIAVAAQWISNYVVTWSFSVMNGNPWLIETFHNGFAYWFYGVMSVLAALFVWRFVPETKQKSLEELESLWKK